MEKNLDKKQFKMLPWVSSALELNIKVSVPKHISTCLCVSQ